MQGETLGHIFVDSALSFSMHDALSSLWFKGTLSRNYLETNWVINSDSHLWHFQLSRACKTFVWFLLTLFCFFPVYSMLFTRSSKIRSIVCQWSIRSQETPSISSHTRGSSSFCSSLWVYCFLLDYWSFYAYSYHIYLFVVNKSN